MTFFSYRYSLHLSIFKGKYLYFISKMRILNNVVFFKNSSCLRNELTANLKKVYLTESFFLQLLMSLAKLGCRCQRVRKVFSKHFLRQISTVHNKPCGHHYIVYIFEDKFGPHVVSKKALLLIIKEDLGPNH